MLLVLSAVVLSGCEDKNIIITTDFEEGELMRINTLSCYVPEMMLYLTNAQNDYEKVFGSEIWTKSLNGRELSESIKDMVLAKVAQVKVMNLMAEDYEITLSEDDLNTIKERASAYYGTLSPKEIELTGATPETVEGIFKEYVIANRVYAFIIKDINPEISDDEARTVTVQHILIKTYGLSGDGKRFEYTKRAKEEARKKAEEIREMAVSEEEPVDFELLAAEYNEDDETTYSFGRGEMAQAFEDAAFMLDNGEISEVVETEFGYHIIKCVSTFDVDETQQNKVKIVKERQEKVFEETYNSFVVGIKKNLNEDLYASIKLITDEDVTTSSMFSDEYLGGL